MKGNDTKRTIMYTDGACEPNPGSGGWAVLILKDGSEYIYTGGEENTTNNRMELRAAIEGLKHVNRKEKIDIFTDSQYLKRGIEEWLENWIARNWKRKGGKLKNIDEVHEIMNDSKMTYLSLMGYILGGGPFYLNLLFSSRETSFFNNFSFAGKRRN